MAQHRPGAGVAVNLLACPLELGQVHHLSDLRLNARKTDQRVELLHRRAVGGLAARRRHRARSVGEALLDGVAHVLLADGGELLVSELSGLHQPAQAPALRAARHLKEIAHAAGVTEAAGVVGGIPGKAAARLLDGTLLEHVAGLFGNKAQDGGHFVLRVVLEVDERAEPALQATVGLEEVVHLLLVAGHDNHQVVAVVLHLLQQGVHGLGAKVVAAAVERVGLVDKEHAAQCALHHGLGLGRGASDVLGDKVRAGDLHQVPLGEDALLFENLGHDARNRGLARAGVAQKHHVAGTRRTRAQTELALALLDLVGTQDAADLFLYAGQTGEPLQLLEGAQGDVVNLAERVGDLLPLLDPVAAPLHFIVAFGKQLHGDEAKIGIVVLIPLARVVDDVVDGGRFTIAPYEEMAARIVDPSIAPWNDAEAVLDSILGEPLGQPPAIVIRRGNLIGRDVHPDATRERSVLTLVCVIGPPLYLLDCKPRYAVEGNGEISRQRAVIVARKPHALLKACPVLRRPGHFAGIDGLDNRFVDKVALIFVIRVLRIMQMKGPSQGIAPRGALAKTTGKVGHGKGHLRHRAKQEVVIGRFGHIVIHRGGKKHVQVAVIGRAERELDNLRSRAVRRIGTRNVVNANGDAHPCLLARTHKICTYAQIKAADFREGRGEFIVLSPSIPNRACQEGCSAALLLKGIKGHPCLRGTKVGNGLWREKLRPPRGIAKVPRQLLVIGHPARLGRKCPLSLADGLPKVLDNRNLLGGNPLPALNEREALIPRIELAQNRRSARCRVKTEKCIVVIGGAHKDSFAGACNKPSLNAPVCIFKGRSWAILPTETALGAPTRPPHRSLKSFQKDTVHFLRLCTVCILKGGRSRVARALRRLILAPESAKTRSGKEVRHLV